MKVYIDKDKVIDKMFENNVKTFAQLCKNSGVDDSTLSKLLNSKQSSLNVAWLLADYFECDINDICSVDWTYERGNNGKIGT